MSKSYEQPAGDDSMLSLKSFTRPITGLANKMSEWLGQNPAVVILLGVVVALGWTAYAAATWFAYEVIPQHDKRILEGMRSMQDVNIEAVKQMRADNARDFRYATDAFTKERERDRERDREREAMMREMRDWIRQSKTGGPGIELGTTGRN